MMHQSHRVSHGAGAPAPWQGKGTTPSRLRLRRVAVSAILCGWAATTGCYAYVPAPRVQPGMVASFSLTDAGRVALGAQVGAGARKLEGVVESAADTGYVLRMRSVTYINGQSNRWAGEPLLVQPVAVTDLRQRQFSKRRTAIAAGIAVGALVAFIATRDVLGFGNERGDGGTPPPSEQ